MIRNLVRQECEIRSRQALQLGDDVYVVAKSVKHGKGLVVLFNFRKKTCYRTEYSDTYGIEIWRLLARLTKRIASIALTPTLLPLHRLESRYCSYRY